MPDLATSPTWIERFRGLNQLDADVKDELSASARPVRFPVGATLFGSGKTPEHLLLLVSGTVRVQQIAESGREIVLYRVHGGESCVMTTACLLAYDDHAAEGIAETEVEAIQIPRATFDHLIARSASFRTFVLSAYARRMTDLFHVIDELAFQRMDVRLAQKLLALAGGKDRIEVTHQQLAAELGTAREVVSRQLLAFQRRGLVEQSRGTVALLDIPALQGVGSGV